MEKKKFVSLMIICIIVINILFLSSCVKEKPVEVTDTTPDVTQTAGKENADKLSLGAKIIYMKYFTVSNSYSISYEKTEDSMAGKGADELKDEFKEWDIIYLDSEKVILEKKVDSCGPQTYIITTIKTEEDEFVCVYSFDDMGEKSVYSIFDTPVMLFDDMTVKELREGIMVTGQDALFRALEDFGE